MGLKRTRERKRQRETAEKLKRHFLPVQATVPVTCDTCGRKFTVTIPAVPKKGGAIHVERACTCGREFAIMLSGRGDGD